MSNDCKYVNRYGQCIKTGEHCFLWFGCVCPIKGLISCLVIATIITSAVIIYL